VRMLLDTQALLWFLLDDPKPFHHKDPFDRLIIAQAMVEGISLVSSDGAFDAYPIQRIWGRP